MPILGSRNAFKTRRTRQIFIYSSGLCDGINDFPKWAARIRLFCVSTSNSQPAASTHSATDSGSLFFIKHKYSSDWWLFSCFFLYRRDRTVRNRFLKYPQFYKLTSYFLCASNNQLDGFWLFIANILFTQFGTFWIISW